GLQVLQEVLAGVALAGGRLLVIVAELALEQAADALDLLLLAQLGGVVGELAAAGAGAGAVLAGLLLQLALGINRAGRALAAKLDAFPPGDLPGPTDVTCHLLSRPQPPRSFGAGHPLFGIGVTATLEVIL